MNTGEIHAFTTHPNLVGFSWLGNFLLVTDNITGSNRLERHAAYPTTNLLVFCDDTEVQSLSCIKSLAEKLSTSATSGYASFCPSIALYRPGMLRNRGGLEVIERS